MRKFDFSMSFRQEISSICKRKMPQTCPGYVEKVEVFVRFNAISVQLPKAFVFSSDTIKTE